MQTKKKRDRFNLFFGIVVVAAGVFFLLQNMFPNIAIWAYFWPILPIVLGLTLIQMGRLFHDGGKSFFVVTGSMLMMAGALILVHNFWKTPYWWSYAWPLVFPGAFGIGQIVAGTYGSRKNSIHNGVSLLILGVVFFLLGMLLFQFLFKNALFNDITRTQLNHGFIMVCLGIFILFPKKIYFDPHISQHFSQVKKAFFTGDEKNRKSTQNKNRDFIMQEELITENNPPNQQTEVTTEKNIEPEEVDDFLTH